MNNLDLFLLTFPWFSSFFITSFAPFFTGWWFLAYPSEKYEFVSWDAYYSQYMEK